MIFIIGDTTDWTLFFGSDLATRGTGLMDVENIGFAAAVVGASSSVDLVVGEVMMMNWISTSELASLVDRRLRLRCLMPDPKLWLVGPGDEESPQTHGVAHRIAESIHANGWSVRLVPFKPSLNCMIVDDVLLLVPSKPADGRNVWRQYKGSVPGTAVADVAREIERLWNQGRALIPLYEDVFRTSTPDASQEIITLSNECWDSIISHLCQRSEDLYTMDPRKFEELVAELLLRDGMDVELTAPSKDGGRDILATYSGSAGSHIYLVECKRFAKDRPVDVRYVRMLYGVVESEKATGGVLVTTSRFTRGAMAFQRTAEHRLWLKDHATLLSWMKRVLAMTSR